jgi:hypothetical protein
MVLKCEYCKIKKISTLFSFSCKCELKKLCEICKYPETHFCKFDYKEESRNIITKANPKIESNRLMHKI